MTKSVNREIFVKAMGNKIEILHTWDGVKIALDRTEAFQLSQILREWSTEK